MRDILATIGSRYLVAFLNLILIFINAKILGVDGMGTIGLIIASIGIATVVSGILSGNTLVYFMNKYSIGAVLWPAYVWIPIGTGLGCLIMYIIGMLPSGYEWDIFLLSMLNSFIVANSRLLLGKENIKGFNIVMMLQGGGLFFALMFLYYICKRQDVEGYVYGWYITNILAVISSFIFLGRYIKKSELPANQSPLSLIKEMMVYGLWGSADNVAEFLTTRLNYFLLNKAGGIGSVGLLDGGTKVSESVFHINRSIGFIAYSRIAKMTSEDEQNKMALQYFKLTFVAVTIVIGLILCIPEWIYTEYLFSSEFAGIRSVIIGLSFGIITLGCNSILSQFFIATGRIRYSTYSSVIGLITLLITGYILIPQYGAVGSALSTSISFTAMLFYSMYIFCHVSSLSFKAFFIHRDDIKKGLKGIKEALKR